MGFVAIPPEIVAQIITNPNQMTPAGLPVVITLIFILMYLTVVDASKYGPNKLDKSLFAVSIPLIFTFLGILAANTIPILFN